VIERSLGKLTHYPEIRGIGYSFKLGKLSNDEENIQHNASNTVFDGSGSVNRDGGRRHDRAG
jgi:hypothetical protein